MTHQRLIARRLAAVVLVGLFGCDDPFGSEVCTLGAYAAVAVRVQDAVSGQPLAAGATLILRDGATSTGRVSGWRAHP